MTEQQHSDSLENPDGVPHRTIAPGATWSVPDPDDQTLSRTLYRGPAWSIPDLGNTEKDLEEPTE